MIKNIITPFLRCMICIQFILTILVVLVFLLFAMIIDVALISSSMLCYILYRLLGFLIFGKSGNKIKIHRFGKLMELVIDWCEYFTYYTIRLYKHFLYIDKWYVDLIKYYEDEIVVGNCSEELNELYNSVQKLKETTNKGS